MLEQFQSMNLITQVKDKSVFCCSKAYIYVICLDCALEIVSSTIPHAINTAEVPLSKMNNDNYNQNNVLESKHLE